MSRGTIDYYLWLNSDWAYLGADRLEAIATRLDVRIAYKPVDLPDVYARTGGVLLPQRSPERQAYRVTELKRWCARLGIDVNPTPRYMCPNADQASRLVIAADEMGLDVASLYKAILRAQWVEERDVSCEQTLREILEAQRIDVTAVWARSRSTDVEATYRRFTDEAVAAGVFGSPSYVYRGEVFWGQDRLDMLEETIRSCM